VAAKLTKAMADRDGGITYDAGKLTVEGHLRRWLSDSVRDTVRQRRVHLIPAIGRIKLKMLTPAHVRGLYRAKLDAGLAPTACSTSTGP
jgi:integrase